MSQAADHKEKPNITLVATYGGQENDITREWIKSFRGGDVKFVSSDNLPYVPPEGLQEVFISSGSEIRFLNEKQRQAWSAVSFKRLVHSRDGNSMNISNEPAKTGSDFKAGAE